MLIERSLNDRWLSNTYLIKDRPGGSAVLVDAGGPLAELLDSSIDRDATTLAAVLLTHHHYDHIAELDLVRRRYPEASVFAHPLELGEMEGEVIELKPDQTLAFGDLSVRALHTPGHTAGMLSFLIEDTSTTDGSTALFTGDTLFKGSVGGVRAPGHTTFADLKSSIMDVVMGLDPATPIYPGHSDATTVGLEWENNPFIRIWRGIDPEGSRLCTALGQPATLVLWARDYDGGHKAWVRWQDGSDDTVPGSMVER